MSLKSIFLRNAFELVFYICNAFLCLALLWSSFMIQKGKTVKNLWCSFLVDWAILCLPFCGVRIAIMQWHLWMCSCLESLVLFSTGTEFLDAIAHRDALPPGE
uniref:Uncharacterized protein n=1 Tax=Arundo donax TaxID=35708 RepID=A0A0A9DQY4_ARUDO